MPRLSLPVAGQVLLYRGDLAEDLQLVSRNRLAEQIMGGLSWPSKMPSAAWGISAARCKIGSALARTPGSVCADCYAMKGHYVLGNVQEAQDRRYKGLFQPLWTPSMVFVLNYFCDQYFRWFDAGDLQGPNHLLNINTIALHTPDIQHWLPSRELAVIRETRRRIGEFAPNLVIRASAAMVDGRPPRGFETTSTVFTEEPLLGSFRCPAQDQGNVCGSCRACWLRATKDVAYPLH